MDNSRYSCNEISPRPLEVLHLTSEPLHYTVKSRVRHWVKVHTQGTGGPHPVHTAPWSRSRLSFGGRAYEV